MGQWCHPEGFWQGPGGNSHSPCPMGAQYAERCLYAACPFFQKTETGKTKEEVRNNSVSSVCCVYINRVANLGERAVVTGLFGRLSICK